MTRSRELMFGTAIGLMVQGLESYISAHERAYASKLGEDYVLGDHWKDAANAVIGLLNGETGAKDPGTIDKQIRALAEKAGIDLDK